MYPHQSNTVQIDAPEYDLEIDGDNQPNTDKKHATVFIQGTLEMIPESSILEDDNSIVVLLQCGLNPFTLNPF